MVISAIEVGLRRTEGWVGGADPSPTMCRVADRRNRAGVNAGRVRLVQAHAHLLPFENGAFDGVIAVNAAQLFDPLDVSLAELSRVMKPGAYLVTLTHDSAVRKHSVSVDAWLAALETAAARHALGSFERWHGTARTGGTVGCAAQRDPVSFG